MMPVKALGKKHVNQADASVKNDIKELKEMVEKHMNAASKFDELDEDADDELELFVGGGKPRCEQEKPNRKRANMCDGIRSRLGKKPKEADSEVQE